MDDLAGPGSGGGARGVAGPGSRARPGLSGPSGLHSISAKFFKAGVEEGERESNLHVVDPQITPSQALDGSTTP